MNTDTVQTYHITQQILYLRPREILISFPSSVRVRVDIMELSHVCVATILVLETFTTNFTLYWHCSSMHC